MMVPPRNNGYRQKTRAQKAQEELKKIQREGFREILLELLAADPTRQWRMGELREKANLKSARKLNHSDVGACLTWLMTEGKVIQRRSKKSYCFYQFNPKAEVAACG